MLPAPGSRGYGEGALWGVGNDGISWSFVTGGVYGLDLNFNVAKLNPVNANCRAYGLQLRCLSE